MSDFTRVWPVASGWQYSVYIGCDGDRKGTASEIIGGWAPTREKAERRANAKLYERGESGAC